TSATVAGLANATTYTFTVIATNAIGNSQPSEPSNPITTPDVPGVPAGITLTPGIAQVAVSWSAPGTGGSPITSYLVTFAPGGDAGTTTASTSVTMAGLTNGTAYTFDVYAINEVGTSLPGQAGPVTP